VSIKANGGNIMNFTQSMTILLVLAFLAMPVQAMVMGDDSAGTSVGDKTYTTGGMGDVDRLMRQHGVTDTDVSSKLDLELANRNVDGVGVGIDPSVQAKLNRLYKTREGNIQLLPPSEILALTVGTASGYILGEYAVHCWKFGGLETLKNSRPEVRLRAVVLGILFLGSVMYMIYSWTKEPIDGTNTA
jgi:hypothetical protein